MSKRLVVLATIAFLLAVALLLRTYWPSSLTGDSEYVLNSALKGDGRALFDRAFPDHVARSGLTVEQLSGILENLVIPRISKWQRDGEISSTLMGGGTEGLSTLHLRSGDIKGLISADVWLTDDGNRHNPFSLLFQSWLLDEALEGKPHTSTNTLKAWLKGLRSDRKYLEQIGLNGLPSDDGMRLRSFDEIEENLAERLRKVEANALHK